MSYEVINQLALQNLTIIIGGLGIAIILLFIACIVLCSKLRRERKRYDFFMGVNRRPTHNLETKIQEYYEYVQKIEEKYDKMLGIVSDLDETMQTNLQKVGVVRYNPFSEMGGNLCFAVALLDAKDNGVVLNGIHSRTGSFTYAKPVEMGTSVYTLSQEEKEAIQLAKDNAYQPKTKKEVKVKVKKQFRHKFVDEPEKVTSVKERNHLESTLESENPIDLMKNKAINPIDMEVNQENYKKNSEETEIALEELKEKSIVSVEKQELSE